MLFRSRDSTHQPESVEAESRADAPARLFCQNRERSKTEVNFYGKSGNYKRHKIRKKEIFYNSFLRILCLFAAIISYRLISAGTTPIPADVKKISSASNSSSSSAFASLTAQFSKTNPRVVPSEQPVSRGGV